MQRRKEAAGKRSFLNNWVAIVGDCKFKELLDFYQRNATVIVTDSSSKASNSTSKILP